MINPTVLSVSIKEKETLYSAYMPFIKDGGIFLPTDIAFNLGDEVLILMTIPGESVPSQLLGIVVWLTQNEQRGLPKGAGFRFVKEEGGAAISRKIESMLAGALQLNKPTFTI